MDAMRKQPLGEAAQEILFHLLSVAALLLAAWLSVQHVWHWDWTAQRSNSLTAESRQLLRDLEQPLLIRSFAPDEARLRRAIGQLLEQFRRAAPERVQIRFVDPELHPDLARSAGVEKAGELVLSYANREQRVQTLSEGHIIHALQRLLGRPDQWIGTLTGHGERSFSGQANHDLSDFGAALENRGYRVQSIDLAQNPVIADNLGLLIIAGPQAALLPAEVQRIQDYVAQGGRLLWLLDSDGLFGLDALAHDLGLSLLPGRIIDTHVRELGVQDPTVALVSSYPQHPATRGFQLMSLFPKAAALEVLPNKGWLPTPLLSTQARSWNETGPLAGQVQLDPELGEQPGPLDIGFALERVLATPTGARAQRVLLIGDGDFLANAFLANVGNQALGLRLVQWLMEQEPSSATPAPADAADNRFHITRMMALTLGLGALLIIPFGLLLTGVLIHYRRTRA